MDKEIIAAISKMQEKLEVKMKEIAELKKAINVMRGTIGEEPIYDEVEEKVRDGSESLRPDQYFGQPLARAMKDIIKSKNQAMSAQEILEQLEKGGFEFPTNWKKKEYLRFVAISLGKNRNDFVQVNTSEGTMYGLWEFYPGKKREREKKKNEVENNGVDDNITENIN